LVATDSVNRILFLSLYKPKPTALKKLLALLICFAPLFSFAQYLNWSRQISGPRVEYIKGTATDASGNIYVVGYFSGTIDFDPGAGVANATAVGTDIWFGKYSSTGNYIWAKQLTGGNNDYGTDIA